MFSLTSKDESAEGSDLTGKMLNAVGPTIAEHWPKIEPYADKALAAAQNDETIELLARNVYPWLPMVVRLAVKEDTFVAFTLEHKGPLLAKLAEVRNKQTA